MPRREDDALSWDGDDDPTLDTGAPATADDGTAHAAALPEGWTPLGRGSETVGRAADAPGPPPLSPGRLPDGAGAADGESSVAPATGATPEAEAGTVTDEPASEGMGTAALVAIGVLGGVYLLFAIGWLVGGLRMQIRYQLLVASGTYQAALWLAAAAPVIWFATTMFATRKSSPWLRWLWLIFGVLLLIPWPFLLIGAVAR